MALNWPVYFINNHDPWERKSDGDKNSIKNNQNKKNFLNFNRFVCNIIRKLIKFNIGGNNSVNGIPERKGYYYCGIVLFVVVLCWIISGFYTIKEAERGVILRFGKFSHLVYPGLNWKPIFIDVVIPVNVESVRELAASGMMLTSDENVVRVEMNVQYRVTEPERYLFSVINADDSLRQATDSALRGVIGKYTMDRILTEGRTVVRSDTRHVLENTIHPYNMGITLLDVNFQTARPPEEVKASFDDAIAARENEQQYIREAEAYANEVQPRANGQAQRILEEGKAYKARTVFKAQGEVERFSKILPEYKAAPKITRERLYIDTMERVLCSTRKVLVNEQFVNNIFMLPVEFFAGNCDKNNQNVDVINNALRSSMIDNNNNADKVLSTYQQGDNVNKKKNNIINKKRSN
ncbi:FtsH protease activity modulator HflK [Blochmannia endosymbiont of Camponotus (Colobopsis) obliquus]|uniref:FtsH protease activity modulator HflK n=1 Tax=Blochmannia endosymbiont of Camponotus (Colobopsis) obliquus TaxID=1505597 RepID=UPI00061A558A|nr:FtsH protease activity modulator HflK [Blochmannia endosymbiont of Camponotus (Colobopsis) obliquus]AKC60260.1 Modulator of FtsH protease HflK [Blochmannia endosymbiont of Camponotus (Colobopsis) obliquus]